ncbi:MAG: hypothetical protein JWL77_2754 [Chthonomonadaceae bacterium]|nr:hypothetical protein [Chthonomonadaceae bacterium]
MNRDIRKNSRASRSGRPGGASGISPGAGNNKAASPATIAALGLGAIAALGFAGWTISNALGGSPPAPVSAPASTPAAAAGTATAPAGSAPVISASSTPGSAVSEPARDTSMRSPLASEATLAPSADPFIALPARPDPQAAQKAATAQAAANAANAAAIRNVAQNMSPLPNFSGALKGPPYPGSPVGTMPVGAPPPAPKEIELVGTLLGNRPSAVFIADQKMVTVPVNGTFAGWKVIRVQHGEAVVTSAGRMLRLNVGMSASGGTVRQTQERPRDGFRAEPGPNVIAPSRANDRADTSGLRAADVAPDDHTMLASVASPPLRAESTRATQDALPPLADTPLDAEGRPKAPPAAHVVPAEERMLLTPAGTHASASDASRKTADYAPAAAPANLPLDPPTPAPVPGVVKAHLAARSRHASKRHHHRRGRHRRYRSSHRFASHPHAQSIRPQRVTSQNSVLSGRGAKAASAFANPIR